MFLVYFLHHMRHIMAKRMNVKSFVISSLKTCHDGIHSIWIKYFCMAFVRLNNSLCNLVWWTVCLNRKVLDNNARHKQKSFNYCQAYYFWHVHEGLKTCTDFFNYISSHYWMQNPNSLGYIFINSLVWFPLSLDCCSLVTQWSVMRLFKNTETRETHL